MENREKRAKVFGDVVGKEMLKELPKVEKILGQIQTNENFVVGNELSIGDIVVLTMFYLAEDKWFKAELSNHKLSSFIARRKLRFSFHFYPETHSLASDDLERQISDFTVLRASFEYIICLCFKIFGSDRNPELRYRISIIESVIWQ